MAEENVVILKVGTEDAIKNIGDLKENIKSLKKEIEQIPIDTEEGWAQYQKTLHELEINQNALKDAMHATTGTMEDVAASANGASKSYNALVHQMASLKKEWRATTDEARRDELGQQIAEINQQLKTMDASVGNFQRNVGNYASGVSPLVEKFNDLGMLLQQMPPTLGAAKESMGKVGQTMQLLGKQPILGIIGLLVPIIMKITDALGENETAMNAVKKIMDSFKPVMDVVSGLLEKLAQGFSNLVDKVLGLVGQGIFDKFISAVAGVGNAILQYMLAPIKSAIAGFKGFANIVKDIFTGDFKAIKGHAKEAGEGIANAWKEGFSFKTNFEEGKKVGADFLEGARQNKPKAKETGEEIGKEVAKGVEEGLKLMDWEKALQAGERKRKEQEAWEKAQLKEMDDWWLQEMEETNAEIDALFEEQVDGILDKMTEKKRLTAQQLKDITMSAASATSSLLNSLADMYESDEKNSEKNAKKIKNLRIASATIDMFQGAVTAFTSAQSLGVPFGQIVGAANAAAVIAMGMANINKIKSTNVSGESASSATPAVVSAPSISTELQSVRNVTTASEEERLNRMASDQRVYIVWSDIEAAGNQSKVQVAESSF